MSISENWLKNVLVAGSILLSVTACGTVSVKADAPNPEQDRSDLEEIKPTPLSHQLVERYSPESKGDKLRGSQLFVGLCSGCHSAEHDNTIVRYLDGFRAGGSTPPNFAEKNYDPKEAKDYLFLKVKYGGKQEVVAHSMPSWEGVLNDQDINDLVTYIMSLSK